jgi:hypothetical protein
MYREPLIIINSSLPRRRESSDVKIFWIPAFAGMTLLEETYIYLAGKPRALSWLWTCLTLGVSGVIKEACGYAVANSVGR